jgi:hypothetical protein
VEPRLVDRGLASLWLVGAVLDLEILATFYVRKGDGECPRRDTRFAVGDRAYLLGPYEELLRPLSRDRTAAAD